MSSQNSTKSLVISALGKDQPGIVNRITTPITECGCNIADSRMTLLGGEFAILMMVEGPWNAIAKLEELLPGLQDKLELTIISKRTEAQSEQRNVMPYAVNVVSLDHPGIVNQLAGFFSSRGINIHELYTDSYRAAHTGTQMFSANMTVHIPSDISIARIREEFLDFCDELNLDAALEPVKG
jgi:glycine cleavage system transcriptional repressor